VYLSPRERRQRTIRAALLGAVLLLGFWVVGLMDHRIWLLLTQPPRDYPAMIDGVDVQHTRTPTEWLRLRDWYQMLRQAGHLPTWLIIAAAFFLYDCGERRRMSPAQRRALAPVHERAALLALAPLLAGLIAEVLRSILRRHRPGELGVHEWSWWWQEAPHGFGLPSSHAAVAFAGAIVLSLLIPSIWPVAMAWAIGCGVSRLLPGAHFASDVYAGAAVSLVVVLLLWRTRQAARRSRLPGPLLSLS
jgi:membrane-associated phospholipid phosphatase